MNTTQENQVKEHIIKKLSEWKNAETSATGIDMLGEVVDFVVDIELLKIMGMMK